MAANPRRAITLKRIPKFDSVPDFLPGLTDRGKTLEDWDDSKILNKTALSLSVLELSPACEMVKSMLESLSSSVTERTAYNVLTLAWNMRSESDPTKRIFPDVNPMIATYSAANLSSVQSLPVGTLHPSVIPAEESEKHEYVRKGCYIAASLLKLFTKESTSWLMAKDHLAENYKKFTDVHLDVATFPNPESTIAALRRLYNTNDVFKNTLGYILYSVPDLTEGRGMTQMLFEQHLSFTGLHIIRLFCKAFVGLRTKPSHLLRALYTGSNESILDQLAKIITEYMGSTIEGKERETYKYARIYNSQMFSLLQTKNCPDLVCILGFVGQSCGNIGTGNVMDIAAISNLSEKLKEYYKKVANNIFTYFTGSESSSANAKKIPDNVPINSLQKLMRWETGLMNLNRASMI